MQKALDLSRREMGERNQVDGRSLGRMERGERLPSVMAFARLGLDAARLLAARCELGRYHQFESGRRMPTMKTAVCIHEVLGFDAKSVWQSGMLERMSCSARSSRNISPMQPS